MMTGSVVEIPTATEMQINIVIAEPVIVKTNQVKCKCHFWAVMCTLILAMFTWLLFIFWNQRRTKDY
jgi:hypothetical protein